MRNTLWLALIVISLSSCQKSDSKVFSSLKEITSNYSDQNKEVYFFDSTSSPITLTTINGCILHFKSHSFQKDMAEYDGPVRIEFTGIFTKDQMIMAHLPTTSRSRNEKLEALESGGEILVQAFDAQDNSKLSLVKSYSVSIPTDLTNNAEADMNLFILEEQERPWILASSTDNNAVPVPLFEGFFKFSARELRWYNVDKPLQFDTTTYSLLTNPPDGFPADKSYFQVNLPSLPNSVLDARIALPVGELIQVFYLAQTEDAFHIAQRNFVMTPHTVADFSQTELQKLDKAGVRAYLLDHLL